MRNKNFSSWAEDFDFQELNTDAGEYNLPLEVLEDIREALNRSTHRVHKKVKTIKHKKECWQ